jgi:acyl carrier protein
MDKMTAVIKIVFPMFKGNVDELLRLGEITGWDSMTSVNLTMYLESQFGVNLSDVILTGQQSVLDVISLIEARGAAV